MKIIVCDVCEAEFYIKHNMDENYYNVIHCPFCGADLYDEELKDEIEWSDDE